MIYSGFALVQIFVAEGLNRGNYRLSLWTSRFSQLNDFYINDSVLIPVFAMISLSAEEMQGGEMVKVNAKWDRDRV